MKKRNKILIGTIVIIVMIVTIVLFKNNQEEIKPFEIEQKACYMPRDCFDTQEEYLDQFPGREIPEILYECLIYCYK